MSSRIQFRITTLVALTALFGLVLAISTPYFTPSPPMVERLLFHNGKSEKAIIDELGQPDRNEQFRMPNEGTLDEFRIQLHNTYPPGAPTNDKVVIREFTWIDGEYFITIWFHQPNKEWVVIDACKWHRDVRF